MEQQLSIDGGEGGGVNGWMGGIQIPPLYFYYRVRKSGWKEFTNILFFSGKEEQQNYSVAFFLHTVPTFLVEFQKQLIAVIQSVSQYCNSPWIFNTFDLLSRDALTLLLIYWRIGEVLGVGER